jgi:hypothetical protein
MLTVKHQDVNGIERVFPALDVTYDPHCCSSGEGPDCGPTSGMVSYSQPGRTPEGLAESIYRGWVFIMNEVGKTVAKYDLGGWQPVQCPTIYPGDAITFTGTNTVPVTQKQHQKKK